MSKIFPRKRDAAEYRPSRLQALCLAVAAVAVASVTVMSDPAWAQTVDPAPVPEGLKGVPVPQPSQLLDYVRDQAAAIRLGKALFWDMQLGSDGKTACASCHFQAGADPRVRNQVTTGLLRVSSPGNPNPDTTFQVGGPNYTFKPDDFPFHKFSDPNNRNSTVLRTHNDASTSQGVFNSWFVSNSPGATADIFNLAGDPVFQINGLQTRRVEPRNSPSMINSIFNFRNFWDGRATYLFNGASPFGPMDAGAVVYKATSGTTATAVTVRIDNASLASLATGPALSDFEMSAAGRTWPHVGTRLLAARPLAQQKVDATDSVLSSARHTSGLGLNNTYLSMVQTAFRPEWWQGTNLLTINGRQYSQAQANFSLFFGLAIQMYGATLVSDDAPFDRHMAGDGTAMSVDAKLGMSLFFSKGKCANCHGGAEFTNASVRSVKREPMSRMVMGNGGVAVYDEGFYNIAVQKTLEDISNGAINPVGRPMALTALAQQVGSAEFERLIGIPPNLVVSAGERIAVNGAFKTPGIRNIELTAPYFHNGDSLTLEQIVQFYNRGGNHFNNNIADVDPDITPLGLSATEQAQLVSFMKALTDERVRFKRAPFDHPQLLVAHGHETDANGQVVSDAGRAKDIILDVPAVGKAGLSTAPATFLSAGSTTNVAQGKVATQSSIGWGGPPERAVDGNTDGNYGANSVSHTGDANQPWWQVDLGASYAIDRIQLWNRTDCCAERLSNFTVFVASTDMTGRTLAQLNADAAIRKVAVASMNGAASLSLAIGANGRYVRVQLGGVNDYLSLAEVQVFGSPNVAPGPTVTSASNSALPGGYMSVSWSGIANPTTSDWIGLYVPGAPGTSYGVWFYNSSCSTYLGATAPGSGTCQLLIPSTQPAGTYELRLYAAGGWTQPVATSPGITIGTPPTTGVSLTASPSTVPRGGSASVSWSGFANPTSSDWIGLFVPGAPATSYGVWFYNSSCSISSLGTARSSGTCQLQIPATQPVGTYELRGYAAGGYTVLQKGGTFLTVN